MIRSRKILALLTTTCLLASTGFAGLDLDVSIRIGHEIEVKPQVDTSGGPPPWAPAHGRRAKETFHYYPVAKAYRNADSGAWIYLDSDGNWRAGMNLPLSFGLGDDSAFVTLAMDTKTPQIYHSSVAVAYPTRIAFGHQSSSKGVPPGLAKKARGKPGKPSKRK